MASVWRLRDLREVSVHRMIIYVMASVWRLLDLGEVSVHRMIIFVMASVWRLSDLSGYPFGGWFDLGKSP